MSKKILDQNAFKMGENLNTNQDSGSYAPLNKTQNYGTKPANYSCHSFLLHGKTNFHMPAWDHLKGNTTSGQKWSESCNYRD